jgi:hypothetical protein
MQHKSKSGSRKYMNEILQHWANNIFRPHKQSKLFQK